MNDLIILDNSIQLSDNLIKMLNANPGDKITIGYASENNQLVPVITIDDGGNKLSKKGTVVFRGKQKDVLCQYGTVFEAIPGSPIKLKGDNPTFKAFTAVEEAVIYTLSPEVVQNNNFNLKTFEYYEF